MSSHMIQSVLELFLLISIPTSRYHLKYKLYVSVEDGSLYIHMTLTYFVLLAFVFQALISYLHVLLGLNNCIRGNKQLQPEWPNII